jgi:lipopolysaccharide/colanic/teichoic acid biosynthesis glycosyltransferase
VKKIQYQLFLKRFFDLTVSLLLLVILSPFLILISLIVMINIGWPVFFIQKRPGKDERIFKMIKFRTMTDQKDAKGLLLPDQLRVRKFGRFLRRTSLDELPELFNVIRGDMSFVGPRPLFIKYLPYFTEREKKRHEFKPGITGLAQVSGRNLLKWDERLEMDVQYIEKFNLWLDFKIIFRTLVNVIKQKDVLEVSSEYVPDFDDYRKNQVLNASRNEN